MISIKSFFKAAPVLPPPPYTWLMTTVPATDGVGMGVGVGFGVGVGVIPDAVTEKSSIANPWSFPVSSGSCHRNQISCPLFTVTVSVADIAVRFPVALPSRAAAVVPVTGPVKLSGEKVVQPLAGVVAPVMNPATGTRP